MWYRPVNEASISTPSMLLFPHRIQENILRMIQMTGGAERLRPHVKKHKIGEVIQNIMYLNFIRFLQDYF